MTPDARCVTERLNRSDQQSVTTTRRPLRAEGQYCSWVKFFKPAVDQKAVGPSRVNLAYAFYGYGA